jgi:hypothetical protein
MINFINSLYFFTGGNSPVNLKIHLKNFDLIGLSATKFISIKGFNKEYDNQKMELKFTIPSWQIFGPYKVSLKCF